MIWGQSNMMLKEKNWRQGLVRIAFLPTCIILLTRSPSHLLLENVIVSPSLDSVDSLTARQQDSSLQL